MTLVEACLLLSIFFKTVVRENYIPLMNERLLFEQRKESENDDGS